MYVKTNGLGGRGLGDLPSGFSIGRPCGDASHNLSFADGSYVCVPDSQLQSLYGADVLTQPGNIANWKAAADAAAVYLANLQMSRSKTLPVGYQITKACIPGVPGSVGGQTGFWSVYGPDGIQQCMTEAQINALAPGSADQVAAAQQALMTNTGPVAAINAQRGAAANLLAISQSPQYAASVPVSLLTPTQAADPAVIAAQQQQAASQAAFAAQEAAANQQIAAQLAASQAAMNAAQQQYLAQIGKQSTVAQTTEQAITHAAAPLSATLTSDVSALGLPASVSGPLDSVMAWVTANPYLAAGGAAAVLFLFMGRK